MICKACGHNNKDGVAFCSNCGQKLTPEVTQTTNADAKPETSAPTQETPAQAPEAPVQKTPEAPVNKPVPAPAQTPIQQAPGTPMMGMQGMGAPVPKPNPNMRPMNAPAPAPKPVKGKTPKGYIIFSIILILALIGGLVAGYFYFNDQVKSLEDDKKDLQSQIAALEVEVESVGSDSATALVEKETEIAELDNQVAEMEAELATLQAQLEGNSKYDDLINFVTAANLQANSNIISSDTVVYLKDDAVELKVYYPLDGTILFESKDSSIATCEWGEDWENEVVATLKIYPEGSGTTTIELANDQNDDIVTIFVMVE